MRPEPKLVRAQWGILRCERCDSDFRPSNTHGQRYCSNYCTAKARWEQGGNIGRGPNGPNGGSHSPPKPLREVGVTSDMGETGA
jgi:hypothetical protein